MNHEFQTPQVHEIQTKREGLGHDTFNDHGAPEVLDETKPPADVIQLAGQLAKQPMNIVYLEEYRGRRKQD